MSASATLGLILFIVICPIALLYKGLSHQCKPCDHGDDVDIDTVGGWSEGYNQALADIEDQRAKREADIWLQGFKEAHNRHVTYELIMVDRGCEYAPWVRENIIRLARKDIDDVKEKIVAWAHGAGVGPQKLLADAEKLLGYGGTLAGIRDVVGVGAHDLESA
jgi:hypothetical protein